MTSTTRSSRTTLKRGSSETAAPLPLSTSDARARMVMTIEITMIAQSAMLTTSHR